MKLNSLQRSAWQDEMQAAKSAERDDKLDQAFHHLERAHIIGQRNVLAHFLAHIGMLKIGFKRHDMREILGQCLRISAALTKTLIWVPEGNTDGADVSAFRSMPLPNDLKLYVKSSC